MTKNVSPQRDGWRAEQIVKLGSLSICSQRDGDTHTIGVDGEIDIASAGHVEQELMHVEATDAREILLDLSALKFIDSTGIRMLVMAEARSRADSNRLQLRRPPDSVLRVLRIAGIEERLPFAD
ncbi:MAG TPA: STAS domain-containing protein [Solirubrobacteraceae bacterium]|jgi:anti-sigma B factor antagonist|nr:STAS domain-containing protein [Solirubrobacteraceae bacterium]